MLWLTARLHRRFLCSRSAASATRLPDRGELSPGRTLGYVGLSEQLPLDWCCGVQHWPLSTATKRHLKKNPTQQTKTQTNKTNPNQNQTKKTPLLPRGQGVRQTSLEFQWRLESEQKKKNLFVFVENIHNFYVKNEVAYLRLIVDESAHSKRYILK